MASEEQEERKQLAVEKKRKASQQNVQKQPEKNTTEPRRCETQKGNVTESQCSHILETGMISSGTGALL